MGIFLIAWFSAMGFAILVYALWLGYKYWKDYEKPTILTVTDDTISYDMNKAEVKDGRIKIVTDKYDIEILEKTEGTEWKNGQ